MDLGPINVNIEGGMDYPFPPLIPVDQHFERPRLHDIDAAVTTQLGRIPDAELTGKSIAITVGSRGIMGLVEITRALVAGLRAKGALPFIVPPWAATAVLPPRGRSRC